MSDKVVVAFDLYGTLLSTESIAKELAKHFGEDKAKSIAALWRRYQLEYTFRMNSMSTYESFSAVTRSSLQHALAESQESLSAADAKTVMEAYNNLTAFPEVPGALRKLAANPSLTAYVFTNGTSEMVEASIASSAELTSVADSAIAGVVTVDEVRCFKPDPRVYFHLAEKAGVGRDEMERLWLVSGNPFDVVGARAVGMNAAWIDRAGGHHGNGGWNDRLGELVKGGPTVVVGGVDEAVEEIEKWAKQRG